MKAWVIEPGASDAGTPPGLRLRAVADPVAGAGDLVVDGCAVGLNRADLSRRAGHYEFIPTRPAEPVAGLEAAGEVVAVGAGVAALGPADHRGAAGAQRTALSSRDGLEAALLVARWQEPSQGAS